jgi:hypothetical protein
MDSPITELLGLFLNRKQYERISNLMTLEQERQLEIETLFKRLHALFNLVEHKTLVKAVNNSREVIREYSAFEETMR